MIKWIKKLFKKDTKQMHNIVIKDEYNVVNVSAQYLMTNEELNYISNESFRKETIYTINKMIAQELYDCKLLDIDEIKTSDGLLLKAKLKILIKNDSK